MHIDNVGRMLSWYRFFIENREGDTMEKSSKNKKDEQLETVSREQ